MKTKIILLSLLLSIPTFAKENTDRILYCFNSNVMDAGDTFTISQIINSGEYIAGRYTSSISGSHGGSSHVELKTEKNGKECKITFKSLRKGEDTNGVLAFDMSKGTSSLHIVEPQDLVSTDFDIECKVDKKYEQIISQCKLPKEFSGTEIESQKQDKPIDDFECSYIRPLEKKNKSEFDSEVSGNETVFCVSNIHCERALESRMSRDWPSHFDTFVICGVDSDKKCGKSVKACIHDDNVEFTDPVMVKQNVKKYIHQKSGLGTK